MYEMLFNFYMLLSWKLFENLSLTLNLKAYCKNCIKA